MFPIHPNIVIGLVCCCLFRVIVYLISAFNLSGDSKITLLSTAFIMSSLYLYMTMFGVKLYKTWLIIAMETITYFNLTIVSGVTWYLIDSDKNYQKIITNISTGITFVQLLLVICYHVFRYANHKFYTRIFKTLQFYKKLI